MASASPLVWPAVRCWGLVVGIATRAARKRLRHRDPRASPQRLTIAKGRVASTGYRCLVGSFVLRRDAHAEREPQPSPVRHWCRDVVTVSWLPVDRVIAAVPGGRSELDSVPRRSVRGSRAGGGAVPRA